MPGAERGRKPRRRRTPEAGRRVATNRAPRGTTDRADRHWPPRCVIPGQHVGPAVVAPAGPVPAAAVVPGQPRGHDGAVGAEPGAVLPVVVQPGVDVPQLRQARRHAVHWVPLHLRAAGPRVGVGPWLRSVWKGGSKLRHEVPGAASPVRPASGVTAWCVAGAGGRCGGCARRGTGPRPSTAPQLPLTYSAILFYGEVSQLQEKGRPVCRCAVATRGVVLQLSATLLGGRSGGHAPARPSCSP